jgi:hypothetical protein
MKALGWPVDDLTDEQIEEGCRKFSEGARAAGITTAQAQDSITRAMAAAGRALLHQ